MTVLFVLMVNLSVKVPIHAVNFLQDYGVVVHFHMLFVAMMGCIAAQKDTFAFLQLELV